MATTEQQRAFYAAFMEAFPGVHFTHIPLGEHFGPDFVNIVVLGTIEGGDTELDSFLLLFEPAIERTDWEGGHYWSFPTDSLDAAIREMAAIAATVPEYDPTFDPLNISPEEAARLDAEDAAEPPRGGFDDGVRRARQRLREYQAAEGAEAEGADSATQDVADAGQGPQDAVAAKPRKRALDLGPLPPRRRVRPKKA